MPSRRIILCSNPDSRRRMTVVATDLVVVIVVAAAAAAAVVVVSGDSSGRDLTRNRSEKNLKIAYSPKTHIYVKMCRRRRILFTWPQSTAQ